MAIFKVKWFNLQKGYGFLANPNGEDIIVFAESIQHLNPPCLFAGDTVSCEIRPPRAIKRLSIRSQYGPVAHNISIIRRFSE